MFFVVLAFIVHTVLSKDLQSQKRICKLLVYVYKFSELDEFKEINTRNISLKNVLFSFIYSLYERCFVADIEIYPLHGILYLEYFNIYVRTGGGGIHDSWEYVLSCDVLKNNVYAVNILLHIFIHYCKDKLLSKITIDRRQITHCVSTVQCTTFMLKMS